MQNMSRSLTDVCAGTGVVVRSNGVEEVVGAGVVVSPIATGVVV